MSMTTQEPPSEVSSSFNTDVPPRVSVITPCYNGVHFVARALESVHSQTFVNWEHIVVDDGSSDNSVQVVERFAQSERRIKLVRQANGGVCKARNNGYAASTAASDYLLFLDQDDCLEPEMLSALVQHMDQHPDVGLVYCEPFYIDDNDEIVGPTNDEEPFHRRYFQDRHTKTIKPVPDEDLESSFLTLFAWNGLFPCICLFRRSIYDTTPGWDETIGQCFEDTDLILQIAIRSKVHYLRRKLARKRNHSEQASGNARHLWRQQAKFYHRWLTRNDLTAAQTQQVTDAWEFRERFLLPHLYFEWMWGMLSARKVIPALRHFLQALRHRLTYRLYTWQHLGFKG